MKKLLFVLCCFVCIASLLCFSACDSAKEESGTTTEVSDEGISSVDTENTEQSSAENAGAVLSLSSDTTEVSPGEKFTLTCTVEHAELFAACDLLVAFDEKQVTAEVIAENVKDLYAFGENHKSGYLYSSYVLYTLDMKDTVIFTVECTVSDECASGDEIEIALSCEDWLIGTDASGDELENITDSVVTNSISVKVR